MTRNTYMDGNILCFPVHHPAFLKLTAVIDCFKDYCLTLTQKNFMFLQSIGRETISSSLHWDPCSGFVLFGGVFDAQQVSQACLPEEHRANIVGHLFYSR